MKQGDCFFNKEAPKVPSHPWVILSDPDVDPDNVLIVNLTDSKTHDDHSCLLDSSDHPGVITKPSCVAYRFANVTSVSALEQAVASKLLYIKPPVSQQVLRKILNGAQWTDELKNAHRELLRSQFLI
jgi:hypothetical protein